MAYNYGGWPVIKWDGPQSRGINLIMELFLTSNAICVCLKRVRATAASFKKLCSARPSNFSRLNPHLTRWYYQTAASRHASSSPARGGPNEPVDSRLNTSLDRSRPLSFHPGGPHGGLVAEPILHRNPQWLVASELGRAVGTRSPSIRAIMLHHYVCKLNPYYCLSDISNCHWWEYSLSIGYWF